ncbi:MAG: DNA mismatch repair endonuclease MutL [Candidatus Eremiobacteraeota bacterium]|nr:DNA mismatch repair endonuclease MutL [Candidatus Eremiobacteraeota bacterium]
MIRVLDPQTVGQIAAGEVVERPLSVVKELVENAVDAGATRVSVSVREGGTKLIEVADDGAGMAPEELHLAVLRHATSKLRTAPDLESVRTLGFRGEGLASIAAVARVSIASRRADADVGARIDAHAEEAGAIEPVATPVGTIVRARELFENVPVRRDYLRSPATEFSRISAWLSTFALAYPHVTFSLVHDGKDVWVLPSGADVGGRLAAVFGKTGAEGLIPLDPRAADDLSGTIRGWISKPGNDRGDRRLQILFVNGRLLRSTLLGGAWTAGYHTFAMTGRHPYGVLFLDLPSDHVDSNVHPTKSDVRLRYAHQAFDAAKRAISATLLADAARRLESAHPPISFAPQAMDTTLEHLQSLFERVPPEGAAETGAGSRLRVLAQLDRTFIVATDSNALVLVDQHAAHERVAYEKIVASAKNATPSEPMLVPYTFELNAPESLTLHRAMDALREGGLDIEAFGERTYRIVATPAGYGARPFDLSGFLQDLGDDGRQRDVRERVWASLACHSVARAGDVLQLPEMVTLVERLGRCENPMHCPHGRPTIVRLDRDAVGRLFKRL